MSENSNNRNNVCEVCGSGNGRCGSCGNMCGLGGYGLVRWILGILIITWVFSIGMKFGEMKGALEGNGYGKHMYFRGQMMNGATGTYPTGGAPAYTPGDIAR